MQGKLTLRLDKLLINKAKIYSQKTGKPVSKLVADYFSLLDSQLVDSDNKLPPITRRLKGALKGAKINKKDYHEYLEDKYL